jgi:membrane protein YdbS with pleckstrin-like domain
MAKARMIPRGMLSSDERVIVETRPSAWLHMKAGSLSVVLGLIALLIYGWENISQLPDIPYLTDAQNGDYGQYIQWALLGVFVICMLFFVARWLIWTSTVYAATDERIIKQHGILGKTYEDIPLTMITNIDLGQSIGKRVLGYGTIIFSTQGLGGKKADMVWEAVPNPLKVRRSLQEVMDIRVKPKAK